MTLYLSKFRKDAPSATTEKIAEIDFTQSEWDYVAEFDGIDIPGEPPMRIHVSCTHPGAILGIIVFQNGSNIINLVASLKNYAHAMIHFRSGYYLDVHVEREKLQKAKD